MKTGIILAYEDKGDKIGKIVSGDKPIPMNKAIKKFKELIKGEGYYRLELIGRRGLVKKGFAGKARKHRQVANQREQKRNEAFTRIKAGDYDVNVEFLKEEIELRNEDRKPGDQISTSGKKGDLIASLVADDNKGGKPAPIMEMLNLGAEVVEVKEVYYVQPLGGPLGENEITVRIDGVTSKTNRPIALSAKDDESAILEADTLLIDPEA